MAGFQYKIILNTTEFYLLFERGSLTCYLNAVITGCVGCLESKQQPFTFLKN